ncbi:MAG: hypothetical protein Q9M23_06025, partial [Mariprofundaceae bacterium]|nr:hypothetical protein [Mariprofundaceae bacterium]
VHLEDSSQTTITNGTTASADNALVNSGAVYVYQRTGSTWAQQAYIKAANAGGGDSFGISVSLIANTLAVGATTEDSSQTTITNGATASADNTVSSAGAVYVYQRTGTSWTQQAYIKAANPGSADNFGAALSLTSDTLVVGAFGEDSNQTTITNGTTASANKTVGSAGAVYVYRFK